MEGLPIILNSTKKWWNLGKIPLCITRFLHSCLILFNYKAKGTSTKLTYNDFFPDAKKERKEIQFFFSFFFHSLSHVWNVGTENENSKSIPSLIHSWVWIVFENKKFIVMEIKSYSHWDFDSSLLHSIIFPSIPILFPFLFPHAKCIPLPLRISFRLEYLVQHVKGINMGF